LRVQRLPFLVVHVAIIASHRPRMQA
jgi:hypothetical protein